MKYYGLGKAMDDQKLLNRKAASPTKRSAKKRQWSGVPAVEAALGPTGALAENRQGQLFVILRNSAPPGVDINQVIAHLECADALKSTHPQWIQRLVEAGFVKLKSANVEEFFAEQVADKKSLERVRDGLTSMRNAFDRLPSEVRRNIAVEAFRAAERADATADVALQTLLGHVLEGIKASISELSASTPPSDKKLQTMTKMVFVAAVFHRYGLPIATGNRSPFAAVCDALGIPRSTVRRRINDIRPNLDQYALDSGLSEPHA